MNYSRRVEANLAEFYELVPHLPKHIRVWLANNAWRIALAGILGCIISMFWHVPIFFTSVVLNYMTGEVLSPVVPYENTQLAMSWLSVLLMIVVSFITAFILAFSLHSLRSKTKAGWDGLYYAIMLNIARAVVIVAITPNWRSFITMVITALVTGYLLFEIRSEFHHVVRTDQQHANTK